MDSRQHPRDSKARFDAEAAEYAFMDDTAAAMAPAPKPAGDLDIFTTAELTAQEDLYYASGQRLYAAAREAADPVMMAAAMEQFELQGAACLELARRFAEDRADA